MAVKLSLALAILLVGVAKADKMSHPRPPYMTSASNEKQVQECVAEIGLELDEFANMKFDEEPSEKMYCFLKCISEKEGLISATGEINQKKVDEMPFNRRTSEELKEKMKKCFLEVAPIKSCGEMSKLKKCMDLRRPSA